MIVAQLIDDSMHGVYLNNIDSNVNVVRDCNNNYIVSLMIAVALYEQENYPYIEIEWCPPFIEEL